MVAMTWIWLLLMSGASAIPLGGAPLPLDPVLSNIAPEDCLWYASYSGQGAADPDSKNQTEQLFAEPQVERFTEEIQTQLMRAVRRAGGPEREKRVIVEQAPKLVRALLTRPIAVYIEDVEPKGEGVEASAALVFNAGDQQDEVQTAIEELLKLIPPDRPQLQTEEVAGVQWQRVPTPPQAPVIRIGWKDAYFVVAVGDETPSNVLDRMDGDAPQWLREIRKEHPIERELSLGYLNVAGVLQRLRPHIEAKDPKAWPAVEALGATSVRAIHGVSGYDDVACESVAHIVTDGSRRGLLGILPYKPLEKSDLQPIPKDALFAVAKCADAAEVWDRVLKIAGELEPKAKDKLEKAIWEVETKLGVNVRDDILASLDDAWVVYVPAGDLMISWLNSAAAVRVKDPDKLGQAVEKLVDLAQAELRRNPQGGSINESKLGEHTLYTFQLPHPAPISPSWCVGDDWLAFSLSPAAVRSTLERKAEDSLAEVDSVADAIDAEGGVAVLAYQDTPELVASVYPWLQIGVQMASGELRKQGIEIDPTILPSKEVILKHLRPGVTTLTHASDGFHVTSRHSLPGGGNLAATAPVGAALLLPAVAKARQSAEHAQSMNNMKNIALAMHNYHSVHNKFPTDVYGKDGKPLLSWRVQLLPYLEQEALYQQLKLDEPWDSQHNRKVSDTIISVFQSPGDRPTAKTRYLAFKGPRTLFPGKEAIEFKDVTDGLSNTIAFVEAAPDHAVPWAKPEDIAFDSKKPLSGLKTSSGSFLAAFGDGSIRALSTTFGPDIVAALITRDGQETVYYDAQQRPMLTQPAAP